MVVADYRSLAPLLPEGLKRAWLAAPERPEEALRRLGGGAGAGAGDMDGWLRRLRLIPYAAIGRKNGLMLGFIVDEASLRLDGDGEGAGGLERTGGAGATRAGRAAVAISPGNLAGGAYQAVVNPRLLEAVKEGAA